ncbi:MAG TPA: hypothetical protein VFP87_14390 [Chitinophagaceae bacterium]|nr:hypothetical protein [Chitinophagaceae bacterium]
MKFLSINLLITVCVITCGQANLPDSLAGTWEGKSICQIRPSPCNDEIAVYHITRTDKPNTYHIVMNKVVDGKEEDMAEYDYHFDLASKTLSCWDDAHKIAWTFHVTGNHMEGTLTFQNKIYRIIRLTRSGTQ